MAAQNVHPVSFRLCRRILQRLTAGGEQHLFDAYAQRMGIIGTRNPRSVREHFRCYRPRPFRCRGYGRRFRLRYGALKNKSMNIALFFLQK